MLACLFRSVLVVLLAPALAAQGLVLDVNPLVAGQPATITITGATPGGWVRIGYSTSGAGPTNSPCGIVLLSQPIGELPREVASAAGAVVTTVLVPPGATGVTVWFQALDVSACALSNGVQHTIAPNLPDLQSTSLTTPVCQVPYLGSIQMTWEVTNVGGQAAPSFDIGFYLSSDPVVDPLDTLVGTVSWPSLAVGGLASGTSSFAIPPGTVPGSYTLGMIADPANAVAESDDGNNVLVASTCGGTILLTDYIELEAEKCASIGRNRSSLNGHPLLSGGSNDYIGLGDDSSGYTTGYPWGELWSLLYWDVSPAALLAAGLPPGTVITAAEMRLPISQYDSVLAGQVVTAAPVVSSWNEYQVTWNTKPGMDPVVHDNAIFSNSGGNLKINVDWTFAYWQQTQNHGAMLRFNAAQSNATALLRSVHSTVLKPLLRLYF